MRDLLASGSADLAFQAVPLMVYPFATVLLTVLVAALAPHGSHKDEVEVEHEVEQELGLFFWVLIGTLIAAIVAGYR